ncbi:DNA polymerase alpha/epsilon subunit B-domain-containing protein [Scenedesmus sp. NREL 46B-D3]|nr:DNA polymerase alpha/epsilon subunit B-domain-containing protein [Scenedesmus sp. NREL 46B-D3]
MERLEDKVAAINARISAWKKALAAALAAAAAQPGSTPDTAEAAAAAADGLDIAPVGVPVQEESYFVGRIVCEVEGGHLNDTAVVLEGDTALSEGARAALDLSQLSSYRLFPGQVVAVKGVSPTGSRILAQHIWTHLPPPRPRASSTAAGAMEVDGLAGALGSDAALSAVVAAGPFCIADDLAYDPLHEMLQELKASPPDMLVLLGPFVDVEQPLIAGGMIDVTFQQLFQTQVVERLQAWQAALPSPCQVVLLPAVRDAFHHPTFPQPAIDLQAQEQQLVSLQNPCSFAAGPALLAAVTHDVLRPLSSAELARVAPGAPADRLAALASHVIGQRRVAKDAPAVLFTCCTCDTLRQAAAADLLLLPSDLAPFAKTVAAAPATSTGGGYQPAASPAAQSSPQVVVINPGRLAKGSSGGTYAHITVAAGSGSLASRCRVDIVRV